MKKILKAREFSSFVFLVALFAIVGIINPAFLSADNIIACFNESVVYIIISAGMAFAIFIGEIDVSVGANLGFTATVVSSMLRDGQNWAVAFAVGLLIGALIGLFNGWGVAVMGVPSLIFTLGTNGVMRGMMYVYTGGAWVGEPATCIQPYVYCNTGWIFKYLLCSNSRMYHHHSSDPETYETW